MILETVFGSVLSAVLQVLFDRMASRQFVNFFKKRKLDDTILLNLKTTLLTVNAVVSDAEEKQISNFSVKEWVDELKDAAYRAEDILDEINTVALQCNLEAESPVNSSQVRTNISMLNQISKGLESKLENISLRLERIANQKDVLGLKEGLGVKPSPRLQTTSLVDESEVKGRDSNKEEIVNFLLSGNANESKISMIAIVGIGGVGKTTLAQLVYNDLRVKKHFDIRAWAYVSEEFDVFKVTKTIFESVTFGDCNTTNLNVLQVMLERRLAGKRFLLVLDDAWIENYVHWDVLRKPLKAGASGSRILVTTRSQSVAAIMGAIHTHPLREISYEACWSVFESHAFRAESTATRRNLELIGKKIVKKCKGLPLAAKTLGGLLQSKVEVQEWEKILNSKIWDLPNDKSNILAALRLSYCYLPSHLKQCFSYCSIFPKGYAFEKEKLVLLWMAEGFLQQPKSEKSMEEVGEEYFHELLSRSFFQQSGCSKSRFIMHDLVNDLAQFASGQFCFNFEGGEFQRSIPEKARHFSFLREKLEGPEKFEALHEVKDLRTFLPLSLSTSCGSCYLYKTVLEKTLPNLRCLRVLSLSGYSSIEMTDKYFSDLKHIRYLDLSHTGIKKLPKSVCSLYNLQTLLLLNCPNLLKLPENMQNLINLRHLDVSGTKLKGMPLEFGRLKGLQTLTAFVVSGGGGSRLSELGRLSHLHGKLSILELQTVVDAGDAKDANLKEKKYLNELVFKWNTTAHDLEKEAEVLDNLQPHKDIEKLTIEKFGGGKLPDWLGDSSFSNMVFLRLSECRDCSSLPSLGQLPSLRELYVVNMKGLDRVGPEFYGNGASSMKRFKSLQILRFENLPNWKNWLDDGENFPSLQELYIQECPELTGNLPTHLPSLKSLRIHDSRKLEFLHDDTEYQYPALQLLHLRSSCDFLMSFPLGFFTKLEDLQIKDCKYLKFLGKHPREDLTSLQKLEISDCHNLEYFPEKGLSTPNLTLFSVSNCKSLGKMPEQMHTFLTSLQGLNISHCPKLQRFPNGGLPPNLHSLSINNCDNLTPQKEWGFNGMVSLTHLKIIGGNSNMHSFPEEGLLPATLKSLHIGGILNLERLDHSGLQHLTSLNTLKIDYCNSLQCLPVELPNSLSWLKINECSLLTQQRDQGENWLQISHIPNIKFNKVMISSDGN